MRKLFIIAAMSALTLGVQAQEKLFLSTYNGTNLEKFDGKTVDVTVNRYIFTGWNTIAMPFSLSEQELDEFFGSDCRLERLTGVEDNSRGGVTLNFMNVKSHGLQANTPYMLYYTGESGNVKIVKQAEVADGQAALTFFTESGDMVTMEGARSHVDAGGLYGVLARDNSEVKFVSVGGEQTTGFYATRCYIRLSSGTDKQLTAQHLGYGEATAINAVAAKDEIVDVYNAAGAKVASQIRAAEVNKLRSGLYIVKGQKVLVK